MANDPGRWARGTWPRSRAPPSSSSPSQGARPHLCELLHVLEFTKTRGICACRWYVPCGLCTGARHCARHCMYLMEMHMPHDACVASMHVHLPGISACDGSEMLRCRTVALHMPVWETGSLGR
jgi:hypothetical protein